MMMELKKGPWTREEDQKLLAYVQEHGHGSWRTLPAKAGLERCGKSCRMRWTNYLRPDIKRGKFSTQEEKTIIRLHALLGNRWSAISAYLPKRTDNEIKNYWNTRLKKRLTRMGIDPVTHKPKNNPCGGTQATNLTHMAQWEMARLEAEARLVHKSKLLYNLQLRLKNFNPPPPPPQPVPAPPYIDVLKVWQASTTQNRFFSPKIDGTSFITNDGMSMYGSRNYVAHKGKMENSMPLHDANRVEALDYNNYNTMMGPMDFSTVGHNSQSDNIGGEIVEDMVMDDSTKYWMELLNCVGSPMGSPMFQI